MDHYFRQRAINVYEDVARKVTSENEHDVLVIGGSGKMYYRFEIRQKSEFLSAGHVRIDDLFLEKT